MRSSLPKKLLSVLFVLFLTAASAFAQMKSQEVSDEDGIPVLIKHLPDWQNARNGAVYTNKIDDLRTALGPRPVFDLIDFAGGTEAVTASYPAGKLLIIEYTNPQSSIDADKLFTQRLAETNTASATVYRRIGNYNAFVFDSTDEIASNLLLDRIKYEKVVQWLSEDPNAQKKAERFIAIRAADIFISIFYVIVGGITFAVLTGLAVGLIYFRTRSQKRVRMNTFSDSGGITRLNLDGLSENTTESRLIGN